MVFYNICSLILSKFVMFFSIFSPCIYNKNSYFHNWCIYQIFTTGEQLLSIYLLLSQNLYAKWCIIKTNTRKASWLVRPCRHLNFEVQWTLFLFSGFFFKFQSLTFQSIFIFHYLFVTQLFMSILPGSISFWPNGHWENCKFDYPLDT